MAGVRILLKSIATPQRRSSWSPEWSCRRAIRDQGRPGKDKWLTAVFATKGGDAVGASDEAIGELGGHAVEKNSASSEQHDPVAEAARQNEVVEDDDARALLRGGSQELHDAKLMQWIERSDGFVGEQHFGLDRKSARKKNAHALGPPRASLPCGA